MNQNLAHEYAEAETDNSAIKCNDNNIFKNPESFSKKVSHERYGSGEAKVTYVEVLDIDGYEVIEAKFNQEVTVKIYFEAYKDTNLAVGFGLFDDKRIQISGGNFASVGQKQISVTNGEKYCVSYKLKLPLQMNNYTIQTSIANELIKETNIAYYDVIPNAYTFTIARRENATLWAKVCLFPSLKIERL
ncbi:MAG: Wzt carbohydrate-binding domain-containing protein, partial [Arcobacteraceae bacterium]